LKIAIDVRSLLGQKTGKEWYTFSLLEKLVQLDKKNTYYLYSRFDFDITQFPSNCKKRIIDISTYFWHIAVFRDMCKKKVDIYLATASYIIAALLIFSKVKVILTVHDLVAFIFSNNHEKKATIIEKLTARLASISSEFIICPSQNTKKDLERIFPFTKKKTIFIPEASRGIFRKIDSSDEKKSVILSKYALPKKYILNIGTLAPRKNLVRLLKAYALLDRELRSVYPLVLVGKKGWYYQEIFDTAAKLNLEHDVFFIGYVDDYDLPYILSEATLFVYPSLYEGFGLPLLEAMACKVPVISSDAYALMEVAQGACHTVKRKDIQDIKNGIEKLLTNKSYREKLVEKASFKIKQYSWEKVAEETLKIIKKCEERR